MHASTCNYWQQASVLVMLTCLACKKLLNLHHLPYETASSHNLHDIYKVLEFTTPKRTGVWKRKLKLKPKTWSTDLTSDVGKRIGSPSGKQLRSEIDLLHHNAACSGASSLGWSIDRSAVQFENRNLNNFDLVPTLGFLSSLRRGTIWGQWKNRRKWPVMVCLILLNFSPKRCCALLWS